MFAFSAVSIFPTSQSQASISTANDGGIVALAIVNTILGGSAGGIAVLLLTKFKWIVKNFVRTLTKVFLNLVQCPGKHL